MAQQIVEKDASREQRELAVRIAVAQIDLLRVRRAPHDLIDRAHGDYGYLSKVEEEKRSKIVMHLARTIGLDATIPDELQELFRPLRGPEKFAAILSDFAARLSALDRYERRALSRRKFAIRAFDRRAVPCNLARGEFIDQDRRRPRGPQAVSGPNIPSKNNNSWKMMIPGTQQSR